MVRRSLWEKLLHILLCVSLTACTAFPDPQSRRAHADELAASKRWAAIPLHAGAFVLTSYGPPRSVVVEELSIYIEGDGLAWIDVTTPSSDPTPIEPLALELALAQPDGVAVYLARPCQFTDADRSACKKKYWTQARYAPEVVQAIDDAISAIKSSYRARALNLIGYSGGGTIATLIAARRTDVRRLVTVAANLDHSAWTKLHGVAALAGSMNAASIQTLPAGLMQWHLVGDRDEIIPIDLAIGYPTLLLGTNKQNLQVQPGFSHTCCWVSAWPRLWTQIESAQPPSASASNANGVHDP